MGEEQRGELSCSVLTNRVWVTVVCQTCAGIQSLMAESDVHYDFGINLWCTNVLE
jgi:hypothetical protein